MNDAIPNGDEMTVYVTYLTFVLVLTAIYKSCQNVKLAHLQTDVRRYAYILACVTLVIVTGLRHISVGADTLGYINALHYYSNLPKLSLLTADLVYPFDFEPGFFLFIKLCAYFQLTDSGFLILVSALEYIPVFVFLYLYCENLFLGVLVYFGFGIFAYSLGIFRQMIALSICLVSVPFIFKRRLIPFVLCLLMAISFHYSAIIFSVFWFYKKFDAAKTLFVSIGASLILLVVGKSVVSLILYLFPTYAGYVNTAYDVKGGSYAMYAFVVLIGIMCLWHLGQLKKDDEETSSKLSFMMFALSILICVQALSYSFGLMGRATCYFSICLTVLIPYLVSHAFGRHGSVLSLYIFLPVLLALSWNSLSDIGFLFS